MKTRFLAIAMTFSLVFLSGCQSGGTSPQPASVSPSALEASSIADEELLTDEELVERLLYLFDPYTLPVGWWTGAGDDALSVLENETVRPLEDTPEDTTYYPVRRYNSINEMKRATEQVVTKEYAETVLYPRLAGYNQFLEKDGKLYRNTSILSGMWPFRAFSATVLSKDKDSALLSVVFQGPDNEESVKEIEMKRENQTWKLNNTPYVELPVAPEK